LESIVSSNKLSTSRLFYLLLVLHLIPLFFGKYFPTQDGPSHLKNAWMLKDMILDAHSVFHQYFVINNTPNPNWFLHLFYALLMMIVPAFVAEKIFLVLYVIFLPLSFRYLVRQINPGNSFIALLIFPLIYNISFYYGFYNFCISIIFYFYAIGYWLKHKGLFNFRTGSIFLLLITLTFFSHPISFFMEGMTLGFLLIGYCWLEWKQKSWLKSLGARVAGLILAFLPSILCFLLFLKRANNEINLPDRGLKSYLKNMLLDRSLAYMGSIDGTLMALFMIGILILSIFSFSRWIKSWENNPLHVIFPLIVLFAILNLFSPDDFADGSFIFIRLVLYFNIIVIIYTAVYPFSDRWKKVLSVAFGLYAIGSLAFRSFYFYHDQSAMEEFMSVSKYIPEGSTILPFTVNNVHELPDCTVRYGEVEPFLHASGYISIERKALSLENYEATFNYFPLEWRKKYYPADCFPEEGDTLKDSAFVEYANRSGVWPDFVLLWGEPEVIVRKKYLLGELDKHYGLVRTEGKRYAWLYVRR
jgi:hypothetical protein